jgi:hypothetical protein
MEQVFTPPQGCLATTDETRLEFDLKFGKLRYPGVGWLCSAPHHEPAANLGALLNCKVAKGIAHEGRVSSRQDGSVCSRVDQPQYRTLGTTWPPDGHKEIGARFTETEVAVCDNQFVCHEGTLQQEGARASIWHGQKEVVLLNLGLVSKFHGIEGGRDHLALADSYPASGVLRQVLKNLRSLVNGCQVSSVSVVAAQEDIGSNDAQGRRLAPLLDG